MTTKQRQKRRASPKGPGQTISEFAHDPEIDATPTIIRSAVERGEIEAIPFNGVKRIPPRERERYIATWGKK
jgi:hypothetical protein